MSSDTHMQLHLAIEDIKGQNPIDPSKGKKSEILNYFFFCDGLS